MHLQKYVTETNISKRSVPEKVSLVQTRTIILPSNNSCHNVNKRPPLSKDTFCVLLLNFFLNAYHVCNLDFCRRYLHTEFEYGQCVRPS